MTDHKRNMPRHLVTLDPETVERAREIGGGNLSGGLRAAVAAWTGAPANPAATGGVKNPETKI